MVPYPKPPPLKAYALHKSSELRWSAPQNYTKANTFQTRFFRFIKLPTCDNNWTFLFGPSLHTHTSTMNLLPDGSSKCRRWLLFRDPHAHSRGQNVKLCAQYMRFRVWLFEALAHAYSSRQQIARIFLRKARTSVKRLVSKNEADEVLWKSIPTESIPSKR